MPPSQDPIVLTNHARERMQLRRISEDMIRSAVHAPDRTEQEADGDSEFIKTIDQRKLHVIAHYLDDERKWLIKSTWVRGEDDSLLRKLILWVQKLLSGGQKRR